MARALARRAFTGLGKDLAIGVRLKNSFALWADHCPLKARA